MGVFIDDYEIDATVRQDLTLDSDVTPYAVEEGADHADHIRHLPPMLVLECIVSDTPFGSLADRRIASGISELAGVKPTDDAYVKLKEIRANRQLVTVETDFETYRNMALKTISIPRSSRDGKSLRFEAVFCKVVSTVVERDLVLVAMPRAKKKIDLGNLASAFVQPFDFLGRAIERSLPF